MPLQKLPVHGLDDINHRRRAREVTNLILSHQHDDSRVQTQAEKLAGVTPVNYAYPPAHAFRYMTADQVSDVLAYGYNKDVTAAIQAAINIGPAYLPNGGYLHSGLTLNDQGQILRGHSYLGTILKYSGAGTGISVASGSHHCEISEVTLNGNDTMTAGNPVLKWTNAAWGRLHRVVINSGGLTGSGSVCFILQEASFDFRMTQCQVDGEDTAELGMLMRDNGAASGPNTSSLLDSRIQQCTNGLDVEDGNNLLFARLEVAEVTSKGAMIRAPIRSATFFCCRFDWNSASSIGVQVDSGAQDTMLINTLWDISGAGITLVSDSGTRTCRYEGNQIIGSPKVSPVLFVSDGTSDNPFIDFGTSAGTQRGLIQITGTIFDFFTRSGNSLRFRVNGGDVVLSADASSNVSVGKGSLATNATDGFIYVPTCAGTPTGTPTTKAGFAPIVVNTTNNKLYFYSSGAWRDAGP